MEVQVTTVNEHECACHHFQSLISVCQDLSFQTYKCQFFGPLKHWIGVDTRHKLNKKMTIYITEVVA